MITIHICYLDALALWNNYRSAYRGPVGFKHIVPMQEILHRIYRDVLSKVELEREHFIASAANDNQKSIMAQIELYNTATHAITLSEGEVDTLLGLFDTITINVQQTEQRELLHLYYFYKQLTDIHNVKRTEESVIAGKDSTIQIEAERAH